MNQEQTDKALAILSDCGHIAVDLKDLFPDMAETVDKWMVDYEESILEIAENGGRYSLMDEAEVLHNAGLMRQKYLIEGHLKEAAMIKAFEDERGWVAGTLDSFARACFGEGNTMVEAVEDFKRLISVEIADYEMKVKLAEVNIEARKKIDFDDVEVIDTVVGEQLIDLKLAF